MNIGYSATFEGKCDICKKKGDVITVGDSDSRMTVTICRACGNKMENEMSSDLIEKFGKKDDEFFKPGVRYDRKTAAG